METYFNFINENINRFTLDEKKIFTKSLGLLNDSLDYSRSKAFEYCIQNKFIKIIDCLLEINAEIDVTINIAAGKYYDILIIEKLIPYGLDLDQVLKTTFNSYAMPDEIKLIDLIKRDFFFETDKSYLLSYASHYGYSILLELLLKHNKLSDKKELNHALLHAIYNNQIKCVYTLIEFGAEINNYIECTKNCSIGNLNTTPICKISCMAFYNRRGMYAITSAVKKENITIIEMLIDGGCIIKNSLNDTVHSIVNIAIIKRNMDLLKLISNHINLSSCHQIKKKNITFPKMNIVKITNENPELSSFNPLISFIIAKTNRFMNKIEEIDKSIFKYILDKGVDPNEICERIGRSAFTLLCNGYLYNLFEDDTYFFLVDKLLEYGADINLGFLTACEFNNKKIVLRSKSAKNNTKVLEYLINKKADLNVLSKKYKDISPLMIVTINKNISNIEKILEMGGDPDFQDINGNTALYYSFMEIQNENYENFQYLAQLIRDKCFSRRYYLLEYITFDIIELIRSFGANINVLDKYGYKFVDYINIIINTLKEQSIESIYPEEVELLGQIILDLELNVALHPTYLFGVSIDMYENKIIKKLEEEFLCPISKTPLLDPVIAADGHSYNKKSIQTHFEFSTVSPVTREELRTFELIPNHHLKSMIKEKIHSIINIFKEESEIEKKIEVELTSEEPLEIDV